MQHDPNGPCNYILYTVLQVEINEPRCENIPFVLLQLIKWQSQRFPLKYVLPYEYFGVL